MQSKGYRWPFLDLVRFGAALLVMFGHFRGLFFESINNVAGAGIATKAFYVVTGVHHEAVVLFFVVSGFLIGGRVWDLIEQGRFNLATYFLDRFSRIYLVLIPALVVVGTISFLGSHLFAETRLFGQRPLVPSGISADWSWAQIPCHLASLQSIACAPWGVDPPLWSLGYEWVFYFLAPLLLGAFYAPLGVLARVSAVGLVMAGSLALLVPTGASAFAWYLAAWFLGAVSARTVTRSSIPLPLGLTGLTLVAACMVLSRANAVPMLMTDTGIAIGLAIALASQPIASFRIADRIVTRGAAFSFSLYLLHLPVGLLVGAVLERLGWPSGLAPPGPATHSAFVVTVLFALLAAYLFARVTEDNTATFRRWLRRSTPQQCLTGAAS
jgi:peptidoglycan/LPS O-acetylase OafA/YrhL